MQILILWTERLFGKQRKTHKLGNNYGDRFARGRIQSIFGKLTYEVECFYQHL